MVLKYSGVQMNKNLGWLFKFAKLVSKSWKRRLDGIFNQYLPLIFKVFYNVVLPVICEFCYRQVRCERCSTWFSLTLLLDFFS